MSEPEVFVIKPDGKEFANNENYQLVNFLRRLDVSEQKPDPTSGAGSTGASFNGTGSSDPALDALAALAPSEPGPRDLKLRERLRDLRAQLLASREPPLTSLTVQSPKLAPELSGPATPAHNASKEASKIEVIKTDAPRPTAKVSTNPPSRGDDPCDDASRDAYDSSWIDEAVETAPDQDGPATAISGKRRIAAVAAVVGLAVVSGAIGGVLATARFGHHFAPTGGGGTHPANLDSQAIEESVARIDNELGSLKQLNVTQSAKINERLDKVEKAQTEPAAKLARLSETIEKLRAAPAAFASATPKETATPRETAAPTPPPAPAPVASVVAAKETTGSTQPSAAAVKPKPEIARLPTVQGWVLRDVSNAGAVIEGRQGLFEVVAGDAMPGLGRVEAIRRQDGRWVVVTTKGLIVAR